MLGSGTPDCHFRPCAWLLTFIFAHVRCVLALKYIDTGRQFPHETDRRSQYWFL